MNQHNGFVKGSIICIMGKSSSPKSYFLANKKHGICENCKVVNIVSKNTRKYDFHGVKYYDKSCKVCGWEAIRFEG
jgi:RNase P subunit RPR2